MYGVEPYRGFESLPLRHIYHLNAPSLGRFYFYNLSGVTLADAAQCVKVPSNKILTRTVIHGFSRPANVHLRGLTAIVRQMTVRFLLDGRVKREE